MMGPPPSMNWVVKGILITGIHEEQANRQGGDDADLHEGAEIVPGGEEEPDGNRRRTGSRKEAR